ncbi:MAG: adenylyltransferase/cytidyltransferase family protein [Candidatus Levybacteria bacterium]|nr:adenylyltransferase/cytidyltransferase family protein [Candidatus Levybacteria bacterium]
MGEIITVEQSTGLVKRLKREGKKIVLVGGIFDLIHRGHVEFLEAAKREGDVLIVLLESDEKTREIKGKNRPINTREDRVFVLSRLVMVDYILPLPYFKEDQDYEKLVKMLQPDIIAVTKTDMLKNLKKRYAEAVGGKLVEVISRIKEYSTTKIEEKI